jgi:hypothetical protein
MGGMAGITETITNGMTGATAPQDSSGWQAQALQAYEQNAARQQAQYAQERAQGAQLQQGVQEMRQMQQGARMPWQESYNAGLQKAQGVPYQPQQMQQMQQYQPPMQQYQPPMQQRQYNSQPPMQQYQRPAVPAAPVARTPLRAGMQMAAPPPRYNTDMETGAQYENPYSKQELTDYQDQQIRSRLAAVNAQYGRGPK